VTPTKDSTTPADAGQRDAAGAAPEPAEARAAAPESIEKVNEIAVPRASGQPILAVVEEHGVARVHAFARRWRSYLYQHVEKRRSWLAPHDLCATTCTGLTSRCLRMMEREGFLCAVRPPATPATK
jgi:hypothetical protein